MYPEKSARRRNKLAGSKWPKIWRTADMRARRTMRIIWSSRRDYRCLFFFHTRRYRQAGHPTKLDAYIPNSLQYNQRSFIPEHQACDARPKDHKQEGKKTSCIDLHRPGSAKNNAKKSAADVADKKRRKIIIQTRSRCVRPENSRNRCRAELIECLSPSASFSSAPPGSCRPFASGVDAGARLYSATRQGALPVLTAPGAPARQTR